MTDTRVAETLERAAHRKRVQTAVIGTILVIVMAAGATGLVLGAKALEEIERTSDYLKECTTPSTATDFHHCFEQSQKATAEAVGQLLAGQRRNADLIVCLLSIPPDVRTDRDIADCEREAEL